VISFRSHIIDVAAGVITKGVGWKNYTQKDICLYW